MYLLISLVNPLTASGKLLSVKTAPLQTRPDGDQPPSHSQPFYTALISLQTDRIQTRTGQHQPRSENDPILRSVDKPADSQIQDQGSNCLHSIKGILELQGWTVGMDPDSDWVMSALLVSCPQPRFRYVWPDFPWDICFCK